jgi:ribosomal protein S18 acetylase RimI-like enzyme
MTGWRLRRAGAEDASAVALVAAATFLETFAGILDGADIVAHVAAKSSAAMFATWATASDSVVTLAEHETGAAPVGYSLLTAPDFPIPVGPDDIELRRIYALSRTHGQGLGPALMERAMKDARALGRTRMLIGVLGRNARARAFYERHGFTLAGERRFLVGSSWFDDVVYVRDL